MTAIISSIIIVYIGGNLISIAMRIGIASATAYALSVLIDIHAFQFIRKRYSTSWWLAPSLSTVISNVIDSYDFYSEAFLKSAHENMAINWIEIAGNQAV